MQQSVHCEPVSASDIDPAIRDRGHGELHGDSTLVTVACLAAVVKLARDIICIVRMQHRRAVVELIDLERPNNAIGAAVGGNRRRCSGIAKDLCSFGSKYQLSATSSVAFQVVMDGS